MNKDNAMMEQGLLHRTRQGRLLLGHPAALQFGFHPHHLCLVRLSASGLPLLASTSDFTPI